MEEERFYQLVRRLLSGNASEEEKSALQRLIAEDERLRLLYRELFPGGADPDDDSAALQAYSAHYTRMQIAGLFDAPVLPLPSGRRWRKMLLPAAACLLGVVLAGSWWYGFRNNTFAGRDITTQKGARTHVVLADGSEVWLNANSRVSLGKNFNGETRELLLSGEAYFDIAPNAAKPFVIRTGGLRVRVLGTTFNIRSYPDEPNIETTLETGSVEITLTDQPGNKIQLKPGQKLSVGNNTGRSKDAASPEVLPEPMLLLSKVSTDTTGNTMVDAAWKEGKLVFDGDDFQRVASKIEKWYNVTVLTENEELHATSFTGVFDNKPLSTVLNTLRETGKLHYRMENDTVYIR